MVKITRAQILEALDKILDESLEHYIEHDMFCGYDILSGLPTCDVRTYVYVNTPPPDNMSIQNNIRTMFKKKYKVDKKK